MSSIVAQYSIPPAIRSVLLKNQPDALPPTEELDALQAELKTAKQRTLERAKKAGDDLRTIEESMRRLKEKEKGKGKAIEKIKKERGCMCSPVVLSSVELMVVIVHPHVSSREPMCAHTIKLNRARILFAARHTCCTSSSYWPMSFG